MLTPRRHFSFGIIYYSKPVFFLSGIPSRLVFSFTLLIISLFTELSFGQTIHDPLKTVTITQDQIIDQGKLSKSWNEDAILIDFEGLGNLEEIAGFYYGNQNTSGQPGYDFGIEFQKGSQAIIDAAHGGSGNFIKNDFGTTILFSKDNNTIVINVDSGFNKEFTCYYTSATPVSCNIYDATDRAGMLLASQTADPVYNEGDNPGMIFSEWKKLEIKFSGIAKSVVLTGKANKCAYDDLLFGHSTSGKSKSPTAQNDGNNTSEFVTLLTEPVNTTEKGKIFLTGGSRFGVNIGKEKYKSDGKVVEGSESIYYDLDFLLKGGYYFLDNFVGGLFIDLEFYNNKPSDGGYGYDKGATFIAGPFARYYVPVSDKLVPFAEAQVGWGIDNSSSKYSSTSDWVDSDQSVFTYRLGAGATYFINNTIGVDFFTGFQHDAYKYKDSGDSESSSSVDISNMFTLQLGLVIVLDVK